jgi:hypothetical protein
VYQVGNKDKINYTEMHGQQNIKKINYTEMHGQQNINKNK